jgi:hypothetical protein
VTDHGIAFESEAVSPECFDRALMHVQQALDLRAIAQSYGADLHERGDGSYKTACFLRSTTGYPGSCADEDASENGGMTPTSVKIYDTDVPGVMRWHCYSCKRGGCVVDLIAHAEGWATNTGRRTSLRALRRAAQLAGLSYVLDNRAPGPRDVPIAELVTDVDPVATLPRRAAPSVDVALAHQVNNFAAQHWYTALRGDEGALGREYLYARGVTDEQADRYGLGYAAAKWDELAKRLPAQLRPLAQRLGLLSMSARGSLIDAQRDRVLCPYMVPNGDAFAVTGFAGRRRNDADARAPKFCNSTNVTGVWEKTSALWGVWQASKRAHASSRVVVCEGVFDGLAFDRIGAPAVAPVGVAFTPAHAAVVRSLGVERVTLADDGDATGRRAIAGWVVSLLAEGFEIDSIDVVRADDGQDAATTPSDLLAQRHADPIPVVDYLRALGVPVPTPPDRERGRLEVRVRELAEAVLVSPTSWATHAEYLAWFHANNAMRAELTRLRKQLAVPAK